MIPFSYECMNTVDGHNMQSFLHISQSGISRYFKRYLLQEALSVFDFTLPPEWDADYFRYVLLGWGYIAILNTDTFGTIPQQCTLGGERNVFYRPTRALIANPLLDGVKNLRIGEDCALIKLMPDYGSICDIVDNYGNMLALAYETCAVNIINSKVSFVFTADSASDAQTYKALYDNIASGDPAVFYKKSRGAKVAGMDEWKPFQQNVGQNFIAPELLETMRTIRDMFLTDIGIPNLSTRKKERTNLQETDKNTVETECKARLWLDCMQRGFAQAWEMFPELTPNNFNVALRFEEDDGIAG